MSLPLKKTWTAAGARARSGRIALLQGAAVFAKIFGGVAARGVVWILGATSTTTMAILVFAHAFKEESLASASKSAGLDVSKFCAVNELNCRSLYLQMSTLIQLWIVLASVGIVLWIMMKGVRAAPNAMAIAGEKMAAAGKRLAAEERAKEEARALDDLLPRKSAMRDAAKRL